MTTHPSIPSHLRLIHDSDQSAYDVALWEGWHLPPEKTDRAALAPSTEPSSGYLRIPCDVPSRAQSRRG
jgi:hypothetical protein